MLILKDINEINYYVRLSEESNLSVRELRERIKNNEYERLDKETKLKLINKEETNIKDLIKNPIIIKNNNYEVISEKVLQKLILEDIESFMKELGESFSFIGIIICKKDNSFIIEYCSDKRIISREYIII